MEERTVDYLLLVTSNTVSSSCSLTQPILGSYLTYTTTTTTMQFYCCAAQDLPSATGNYYILEIPLKYPFPSSTSLNAGGDFTTIVKKYASVGWMLLKSTSTANCKTNSISSTFDPVKNPTSTVSANTLTFKGYAIYQSQMTDLVTYGSISTAITVASTTPLSCTMTSSSISMQEYNIDAVNLIDVTFTCTGTDIPVGGYLYLEVLSGGSSVTTDPYYFTIYKGLGTVWHYTLSGSKYTIKDWTSAITSGTQMRFLIPVKNPSSTGATITITASAYDNNNNQMGSYTATTPALTNAGYSSVYSLQSHYLQFNSLNSWLSTEMTLYLNLPHSLTTTYSYVTIDFTGGIQAQSTNRDDRYGYFDGSQCEQSYSGWGVYNNYYCYEAKWTTSTKLQYTLVNTFTVSSGVHKFNFAGSWWTYLELESSNSGVHLIKVTVTSSVTEYYTFLYRTPTSKENTSSDWYGLIVNYENAQHESKTTSNYVHYLLIEYPVAFGSLNGFSSDLGFGVTDGYQIPGLVVYSSLALRDCILRQSVFDNRAGILCRSPSTNNNPDLYILLIKSPASAVTVLYSIMALYQDDTSRYTWHSMAVSSQAFQSGSVTTTTGTIAITNPAAQSTATWDFTNMINTGNLGSSGYNMLIQLTNYQSAYQLGTYSIVNSINTAYFLYSGYILAQVNGADTPQIQFSNPLFSRSDFAVKAWTFGSSNTLNTIKTTSTLTITTGTLSSKSIIAGSTLIAGYTSSLTLKFTYADIVPAGGQIQIVFPTTYFSAIDCSICTSDYTDQDASNQVTYTVTTGSDIILTITKFQKITAGTYNIYGVHATFSSAGIAGIDINTYYDTSTSYPIDEDTVSLTISAAPTVNPVISLYPRLSFMTGFINPTAGSYSDLVLYFNPTVDVDPSTTGTVKLTMPSSSHWFNTDGVSSLYCLVNGDLTTITTTSTYYTITPNSALSAGTLYTIIISARNGKYDGLSTATTTSSNLITLEGYTGATLTQQATYYIKVSPIFTELYINPYVKGSGSDTLYQLNIKTATTVTGSNNGAFVVEWPVYSLSSAMAIFSSTVGSTQVSGTYFPCELFSTGSSKYIPMTGITCMLIKGYTISSQRTSPTKIVVLLGTNTISSGTSIVIGFPGVTVPTTSRGPDLYIYSREISSGSEVVKDYLNYKYVSFAHSLNSPTSITKNFQSSFSNSVLMSTAVSFSISLQPVAAISTSDYLVFTYDPTMISVTTGSAALSSPSYSALFYYTTVGWIVIQPSSAIGTGSATTFTFAGMNNPSYISGSSKDYISARQWDSFSNSFTPGTWDYTYEFSGSTPSPLYTLGTVTPSSLGSSFGCLTCASSGTSVLSSQYIMYKLTFQYSLNLPSGAIFELIFPKSTNEYQSIAYNCEASSSGFSTPNSVYCSAYSTQTLRIYSFGTYTKNTNVVVYIKALNPPIAFSPTSGFTINVYYDSSGTYNIGTDSTNKFTVTGLSSVPVGTMKIYIPFSSEYISARTTSNAPLIFIFKTSATITKNSGTVAVTVSSGTFAQASGGTLICYFIDPTNSNLKYIAKSCTYSSDVYTITAPIYTNIASGQNWIVSISTYGATSNGLTYPSAGATFINVDLNSVEMFDYNYYVVPSALTIAKVISYCRTTSFSNVFQVYVNAGTIGTFSSGMRIEAEFDVAQFASDLGTGISDGNAMDCMSDMAMETSTTLQCSLHYGNSGSYPYRPLMTKAREHNQDTNSGKYYLSLANVINPSSSGQNVAIRVKYFDISSGSEVFTGDEMIYFVLGSVSNSYTTDNENSYINSMNTKAVAATSVTFSAVTNVGYYALISSSYVFWRFPYGISTSTTETQSPSGNSQTIDGILGTSVAGDGLLVSSPPSSASYTGTITWNFANFVNPPYIPASYPILTADIVVQGFYVVKVVFDQNLANHVAATVTVSHIWAGDATNYGYLGGRIDMDILFTMSSSLSSSFTIEITFPSTWTTDDHCTFLGTLQSPMNKDWIECNQVSTNGFLITNINAYTKNDNVNINGWVTLPNAVGPHTVTVTFYYTYPTQIIATGTGTYTLNNVAYHSQFSMGRFIYNAADIFVPANGVSPFYLSVPVPSTLTMNAGYVNIDYPASSWTTTLPLVCVWEGTSIWQASTCSISGNTVTIVAPEYNDITAGTWKITVNTFQGIDYNGITFPPTTEVWTLSTSYSDDGIAGPNTISSTIYIKVPLEQFATDYVFTFSNIKNTHILLEVDFSCTNSYTKGVPQPTGRSYLIVRYPTKVNGNTILQDDFGRGFSDKKQIPCFPLTSFTAEDCYLIWGSGSSSVDGKLYINNYTPALSTSSQSFYIPWLVNPATQDRILQLTIELWELNSALKYELMEYKEIKYIYAVLSTTISTTNPGTLTYHNTNINQQGDIDFTFVLPNSLTGTADEAVVWTLTETMPTWSSSMCPSSQTCEDILSEHLIFMRHPSGSGTINNGDIITLQNVMNPEDPYMTQTWTIWIYKGYTIQKKIIYNANIPFTYPTPSDFNYVTWRFADYNVPNPLTSRYDQYTLRFRISHTIYSGYTIEFVFPTSPASSGTSFVVDHDCDWIHGLSGSGLRCAAISSSTIQCTGFNTYFPDYPAIVMTCMATNPPVSGTSNDFELYVYDASSTLVYSDVAIQTFVITSAPTLLNKYSVGGPWRTREPACENTNYADITIYFTGQRTDITYQFKDRFSFYLPTGVSLATLPSPDGAIECTFNDMANQTPGEYCTLTGSRIDVGITDQQGLVAGTNYVIHVYTRDATAGLGYNGFVLPTFPEWESWYVQASTGSSGESSKVVVEDCPVPFTSLSLTPYSYTVQKWNIYDLTFQPSRNVPVGGGIAIEFTTYNEIDQVFDLDLGLNMAPLVPSQDFSCIVESGFGSPSPGTIKCTVYKSSTVSYTTPVLVTITGHTTAISSSSSHSIRLAKLWNPIQSTSPILNESLRVHFKIYSFNINTNSFTTDRAKYNLQTLLSVYDPWGSSKLTNPSPTIIDPEPQPTTTVTNTYSVFTSSLQTQIDLGVTLDTSTGFVIYEFDNAFILPTTGSTSVKCNGSTSLCEVYKEAQWIAWRTNQSPSSSFSISFLDAGTNTFKTPNYYATSYTLSAYIIEAGHWEEEHYFTNMDSFAAGTLGVSFSHRLSSYHRLTYDVWTITITPSLGSTIVKRIDIYFPSEFSWIDATCKTTGLTQISTNSNPISCISDCSQETCTNHITITNYDPLSAVNTISVIIGAMNPKNAVTTSNFNIYYYASTTDTTQIIEKYSGNSLTIDSIIYPYDFWVELPTLSIYDRGIQQGAYGEIWIRTRSRVTLPANTGWYKVVLPNNFDIAAAATPKCTIVHTDVPFQNWPDRSSDYYNHIVVPNCIYSNGVLNIMFPGTILRQFYGVKPGICTYLVLTTYPSPVSGQSGFRAPLLSGCSQFQFYAMDGATVLEESITNLCINGNTPTNLQIYPSTIDTDTNSIYMFSFTTSSYVPNSYFYYSGTYPGPQSAIQISFESYESFQFDLAGQYDSYMQVFCQQITGISPPSGEYLSCKLTLGSTTSSPTFTHYPAIITITNFNSIPLGTQVSFHLPVIRNPNTDGWVPQITVGIYQVDYLGLKSWIEAEQTIDLTAVTASTALSVVSVCTAPTTDCWVTNKAVKSKTTLNLYFKAQSITLNGGSMIVIQFPSQYEDIPISGVSAYIQRNPVSSTTTDTFIIQGLTVVTYPLAKMVALTTPSGSAIYVNQDCTISLLNFINPSYIDSCSNCKINYYSISPAQKIVDQYQTDDIYNIFGFTTVAFSLSPISLSSVFANSADVTQTYTFSPLSTLPSGSQTKIVMPTTFPDVSALTPVPTCSLNITATCAVSSYSVIITGYSDISAGTKVQLKLSGTLNPTSALLTTQSPSGFYIQSQNSNGKQIAYSEFPVLRINGPNPVTRIQVKIITTFPNSKALSAYTFSINSMQGIPKGSDIVITFPSEYSSLPTNERCFVSGKLISYTSCSISGLTMTISTNEDIARYESLNITIPGVLNPTITTADSNGGQYTSAFTVNTYFAGQLIDEIDPSDSDAKVYIKAAPGSLIITQTELMPQSEGEMALYSFWVTNPVYISNNDDISMIFQFPIEYSYQLTSSYIDLFCYSSPDYESCNLNFPRMIEFRTLSPYTVQLAMLFKIFAITNPVQGTTNPIGIYLYNNKEKTLIGYNNTITFVTKAIPSILSMYSVESSSLITHTYANYKFNFTITDKGIDDDGGIYVDWPGNYYKLFYEPNYTCSYIYPTDQILTSPTCLFLLPTGYRRTAVSIATPIPTNYGDMSVEFNNVPTLQQEGLSGSFIMRIFDDDIYAVTARSYPNLTPYSNLYFQNIGYRIFVNTTVVYVYKGSYSYPIKLTLEKPCQTGLQVIPNIVEGTVGVDPKILYFQYEYTKTLTFRVYAPMTANTTTYTLHFEKNETSTDPALREYKPMIDIPVIVLEPINNIGVYTEDISHIPLSGTSLPVRMWLDKPAYDELNVTLSTSTPEQPDYVFFNPSVITFKNGKQADYFTVTLVEGAISGYIKFTLSGNASASYKLIRQSITFQTLPLDVSSPVIKSARLYSIARTSASVYIQSSKVGLVHYIYTAAGTSPPIMQMLVNGDTMWCDALQVYGKVWTDTDKGVAIIPMTGLTDNTAYTLYYTVQSRSNHTTVNVETYNFKTLPTHLPAKFRIYVTALSSVEEVNVGVAKALAFPLANVLATGIDPALGITRRMLLQNKQLYYEFTLFVNRDSSMDKPITYVNNLDNNIDRLTKYVPSFNTSSTVSAHSSEYSYLNAQFTNEITVVSDANGTLNASTILNVAGTVYGVLLGSDKKAPSSVQIRNGLDAHNVKVKEGRYSYMNVEYGQTAYLNFTGLINHAEMVLYLTAENALPGNPDLMEDEFTIAKSVVVGSALDTTYVYIFKYLNSAAFISISMILVLII
ncbi:unnamed protein product [Blepharisma stoltei]|uniref:Uncharacterized protein n=1 Tax=Blepharisma stoltei TaxID=1481888 RepID=A0AAU9JX90_9CILI|nr:unnamed protein product [Blepharisma stoltei]